MEIAIEFEEEVVQAFVRFAVENDMESPIMVISKVATELTEILVEKYLNTLKQEVESSEDLSLGMSAEVPFKTIMAVMDAMKSNQAIH